jgi:hypothetical protein
MGIVFDYSFARPSPTAMYSVGAEGVIRYLAGGTDQGKEIDLQEVRTRDRRHHHGTIVITTAQRDEYGDYSGSLPRSDR